MDNDKQQNTNPQQPTTAPKVAGKKVIQPSETFVQEIQAQQPVQMSVSARDFRLPTEQTKSEQQPTADQPIAPVPSVPTPYSVSASQMDIGQQGRGRDWGNYIKPALISLAVLIVVVGGFLFVKNYFFGLTTKTLSNDGYNYSFKFYRSAKLVTSLSSQAYPSGIRAYTYNDVVAIGDSKTEISTIDSMPKYCTEIGSYWTQAFTVQIYGSTYPVCAGFDTNRNVFNYVMGFSALNHNQFFVVAFAANQYKFVQPKLQTIFSSVKVSQ